MSRERSALRARGAPPSPEVERARTRRVFLAIAGLALALRLVYFAQARGVPTFDYAIMDGAVYDAWARRIADGDWIGTGVFYQAPLYPYLLALLKVCGADGLGPIRIVQALLGAASCGMLFLAGASFFSRRVGVIAGVALALYPPAIYFDGLIQKASLGGFAVVLVLWCMARAKESPSIGRWLALGAALAALMLTREETVLLAPVLAVWIFWQLSERAWAVRGRSAGAYVGGLALVLLPVAFRNLAAGGEFVLTTSQAGSNFYIGNHEGANGLYAPLRPGRSNPIFERADAYDIAQRASGRELGAREVSDFWFAQSFAWIGAHPGEWGALLLRKARLLINAFEIPDSEDQHFYEKYAWLLSLLATVLHLGVLLPLAAAGIWLTWDRRRELAGLLAVLATLCIGVVAFYVFARYRYPIVPIVLLFAAAAVARALELFAAGDAHKLTGPAIAAAVVALASNWTMVSRDEQLSMAYSNAGATLADHGDDAAAEKMYRAALALDPSMADTQCNLGEVLGRNGRSSEAIECFRAALALRPDDARFWKDIGTASFENGDTAGAILALTRSNEIAPSDAQVANNLRFALEKNGEWSRALEVVRATHASAPGDLQAAVAVGWLLATVPDEKLANPVEAVRIGEELARSTERKDGGVLDLLAAAYARAGRFDEANSVAGDAAKLVESSGDPGYAAEIRARAAQYARREPYVQGAR
jgi:Flp pilus assembly protein TadD/4-amino-4-deoxy-L-arabinose transferase-like glycosyltransferase